MSAKSKKQHSKKQHPKKKCCVSKPRCQRCPIRMLKSGTLPDGYAVKKRKLVKVKKSKKTRQPIAA